MGVVLDSRKSQARFWHDRILIRCDRSFSLSLAVCVRDFLVAILSRNVPIIRSPSLLCLLECRQRLSIEFKLVQRGATQLGAIEFL